MASKDRIQRLKEETKVSILDAAFKIAKDEGWQALSMRKIADQIEYTAPIIYEYFANKEAILQELTKKGHRLLSEKLLKAKSDNQTPAEQLKAMWMAYWDFAFEEKELYQLMFGVEMSCCIFEKQYAEIQNPADLLWNGVKDLIGGEPAEDEICRRYYTLWSVVHGLVSINLVKQGVSDEINRQVLQDAIDGIITAIKG